MENNYVYVVSFDGYLWGYGSESYLLGIYSTQELAEEAVNVFKKHIEEREDIDCNIEPDIRAIVVDHTYELRIDPDWGVETQIYLGGYIE